MLKNNNMIRECTRLFSYAKPHWKMAILTLICMGLFTLFIGAQLALIKPVTDRLIKGGTISSSSGIYSLQKKKDSRDAVSRLRQKAVSKIKDTTFSSKLEKLSRKMTNSFTYIGILAAILAPFIFAFNYLQQYLKSHVMWSVLVDIRNQLCEHLLPQSLNYFENKKSGELISRLTNDITATQFGLMILFDSVLLQPMRLLCGLGLAFYFSWKLSLFTFVIFPIVVIPVLIFGRKIKKYGRRSLMHLGELTDAMREMFTGIRIVKAFKMENEESIEFRNINSRFFKRMMQTVKAKALNASTTEFIYSLGLAVIIILGGYVVTTNKITPGELGGFVAVTGFMILTSIKKLAKCYGSLQESLAGASRIFELLDQKPSITDSPNAIELEKIEKDIAFKKVSFSYDTQLVLKDINLTVDKGQLVAIVGESGAGKSTLLDLVPRFYDPLNGTIEIDGTDIRLIKRDSLLEQIAIVSQQTFLFNRSFNDNILYGRKSASLEEIEDAAKAANIHDFITNLPKGYDTLVGEQGVKLSGGQRQRVTIARAILKNAPILILDEATSSLDSESEKLVQEALDNLMRGKTIFVIAHRLSTIRHADRIVVLKNGCIVETGTHDELIEKEGEYKKLYRIQFET
ncbi:MAG: ABC transporter MsbA [Candidatus Scalindua rubra]|uniref:ABC transporter MsbA n=1 Tax=Candidatus Scalindua rubra TaxID=1872076 RepID=A0A1E3XBD7_9BACT|nr:MAG: ABC transporter MsbA [Candidatus Scalindua rubra]